MTYADFSRVAYDQHLDLTSFSLPTRSGELKTWFFAGDHAGVLAAYTEPSAASVAKLEEYIEAYYVGHRTVGIKAIHGVSHEIELRELCLESIRDPRAVLSFAIDPVLEQVKASRDSVALLVRPAVLESLRASGYLRALYSYVMSRELSLNRTTQEIVHEKRGGSPRKLAELKARHMPRPPSRSLGLPRYR